MVENRSERECVTKCRAKVHGMTTWHMKSACVGGRGVNSVSMVSSKAEVCVTDPGFVVKGHKELQMTARAVGQEAVKVKRLQPGSGGSEISTSGEVCSRRKSYAEFERTSTVRAKLLGAAGISVISLRVVMCRTESAFVVMYLANFACVIERSAKVQHAGGHWARIRYTVCCCAKARRAGCQGTGVWGTESYLS